MKNLRRYLILPLIISSLFSCKEKGKPEPDQPKYKDGDVVMLNDFESYKELSKVRILNADFSYRSKFGLNEDTQYIKSGSKSMYAESHKGDSFSFQVFLDDANIPLEERYNFRTVHLDVFNDTDKEIPLSISVNMGDKNDVLLRQDFSAEVGGWTAIDYDLSSIALEYNYDKIRAIAVSFKIPLEQRAYFDNFHLVAGAKATEEDLLNQDKINSVRDKIDALPEVISESDYAKLNDIYEEYISLSDLYRRVVPNYTTFVERSNQYFTGCVASKPLASDQPFLCNDEFYAINQYETINGTNAEFTVVDVPNDSKFASIKSKKWLKMKLFDTANNMVTVHGTHSKTVDYETMTTAIYNDSDVILRIWFNYANMCYVDVPAHQLVEVEMSTSLFNNAQSYWAIHHVINGQIVAIDSAIYMAPFVLHRMSDEDIKNYMLESFAKLPEPASLNNDDAVLKYLSVISNARKFYEKASDQIKALISQSELTKLAECEAKVTGYGVIYSSAIDKFRKWDYGVDITSTSAVDEQFGDVCKCTISTDPMHSSGAIREQSFISIGDFDEESYTKYARFRVYVYNPTNFEVSVAYRNCNYTSWEEEALNCGTTIAPHTWGSLECDIYYLTKNKERRNFVLMLQSSGVMTGDFLVSSVYGLPESK